MGVKKGEVGEGCFMLKADPRGRKQTDGKGGSENFLLEVYLKEQCQKISHNSNSGNYHKIEWNKNNERKKAWINKLEEDWNGSQ